MKLSASQKRLLTWLAVVALIIAVSLLLVLPSMQEDARVFAAGLEASKAAGADPFVILMGENLKDAPSLFALGIPIIILCGFFWGLARWHGSKNGKGKTYVSDTVFQAADDVAVSVQEWQRKRAIMKAEKQAQDLSALTPQAKGEEGPGPRL